MPEEPHDSSSSAGAMPAPGLPATGTTPTGATPAGTASTLEEALARMKELERSLQNATEERDRHRKKLSRYEEAEKQAQEAQLSEVERLKKQHAELQAQHEEYTRRMQERVVRYELEREAARLGLIRPELAFKLIDWTELEFAEDGTPKNADKLLEKLLKEYPELAKPREALPFGQPVAPQLPAMNPGRSSIASPNQLPPGPPPRLSDIWR